MGTQVIPSVSESRDFDALRVSWPTFHYEGYDIHTTETEIQVTYRFSIPGLTEFRPRLSFPITKSNRARATDETGKRILFNIGMIELISYWKTTCAPEVHIHGGTLAPAQIRFWKQLYYGGLGEFFYRNGIQTDERKFMRIVADEPSAAASHEIQKRASQELPVLDELVNGPAKLLVPVGGGKDSAVSLARLHAKRDEIYAFAINATGAALDTMDVAGIHNERRLLVKRTLDRNMLEMNRLGYWNGHTPFSAVVAFVSMYVAYVYDLNYIVLSNESSADEATVAGTSVNHQFSKSTSFEQEFQAYTEAWLGTSVYYFSLMRPFAEIAIAREFAKHPAYFSVFRSCNVGSKENRWCGNCAKCLFIAVVLSPFMETEVLWQVMGKDLFQDPALARDLGGLCGRVELKPWECVGTVSEVNVALTMTIARHLDDGVSRQQLPELLKTYVKWVEAGEIPGVYLTAFGRPITVIDETSGPLTRYNEDNRVPKAFLPYIKGMLQEA